MLKTIARPGGFLFAAIFLVIISFMLGAVVGGLAKDDEIRGKLIKSEIGYYSADPVTGRLEFKYKTPCDNSCKSSNSCKPNGCCKESK